MLSSRRSDSSAFSRYAAIRKTVCCSRTHPLSPSSLEREHEKFHSYLIGTEARVSCIRVPLASSPSITLQLGQQSGSGEQRGSCTMPHAVVSLITCLPGPVRYCNSPKGCTTIACTHANTPWQSSLVLWRFRGGQFLLSPQSLRGALAYEVFEQCAGARVLWGVALHLLVQTRLVQNNAGRWQHLQCAWFRTCALHMHCFSLIL